MRSTPTVFDFLQTHLRFHSKRHSSGALHPAVHHISGEFATGSHTAIVGPNGAGKTTLLKALVGLLPSTGQISIHGEAGYLSQLTELDRQFPLTVEELALAGD